MVDAAFSGESGFCEFVEFIFDLGDLMLPGLLV